MADRPKYFYLALYRKRLLTPDLDLGKLDKLFENRSLTNPMYKEIENMNGTIFFQ